MINSKEAIRIYEEYKTMYSIEPYTNYMDSILLTSIKSIESFYMVNIKLKKYESIEDYCIDVTFNKKPPDEWNLPKKYKGLRVFYGVI